MSGAAQGVPENVEAAIRWVEYLERKQRQQTRRRRWKKAGLIAMVPLAGPLVGSIWAENDAKGWR